MNSTESLDQIADEAARWVARHDRGLSRPEQHAFELWLAADPRHPTEFERLHQAWDGFALATEDPELVALAHDLERDTRAATRPQIPTSWWVGAGTFTAAAALVIAWITGYEPAAPAPVNLPQAAQGTSYTVVPRAAHTQQLPDGSVAELRGDAKILVAFTAQERHIQILQGEAHFAVTKDPSRPFTVAAGDIEVRAVGTAFNVRREDRLVSVLVTEGHVAVDDRNAGYSLLDSPPNQAAELLQAPIPKSVLRAGQLMTVNLDAAGAPDQVAIVELDPAGIEKNLAWKSTRLVFQDTPLRDAIAAFNLHGGRPLTLAAKDKEAQRISGVFKVDNTEGFVRLLELTLAIRAEEMPDGSIQLVDTP